jgi:hypothetical protein
MGLYILLIDPVRRNDAKVERAIERTAIALHRAIGVSFALAGTVFTRMGEALRSAGGRLNKENVADSPAPDGQEPSSGSPDWEQPS